MQVWGVISLALVLIVGGAAYLLYPLTSGRRNGKDYLTSANLMEPAGLRRELQLAREERDQIYSSLAELDHDFKAGDLNREDYLQLHSDYKNQAVEALINLDRLEDQEHQVGLEIEQTVAKLLARARLSKKTRLAGTGAGATATTNASPSATTVARVGQAQAQAQAQASRTKLPGQEEAEAALNSGQERNTNEEDLLPLRLGRFCQRCRHEAERSDAFCSRCGLKLARLED